VDAEVPRLDRRPVPVGAGEALGGGDRWDEERRRKGGAARRDARMMFGEGTGKLNGSPSPLCVHSTPRASQNHRGISAEVRQFLRNVQESATNRNLGLATFAVGC
jgi:hypothetical protein